MEAELLQKVLDTGAAVVEPKTLDGAIPFVIVPDGYRVQSLESQLKLPTRIKQNVSVFDPESFTKYFTDYCHADSRVFIDVQRPQILGVLDYHPANADDADAAEWTSHRLNYVFRHTPEWLTWSGSNRKDMTQLEFARFIEDNLPDIINPSSATMLEVSRSFEAKKNVNFSQATRLSNNEVQFQYEEEIKGRAAQGTIDVPETFDLSIAPYEGSEQYKVTARFRYRFGQDGLKLRYELVRPHKVLEDAVNTVVQKIRSGIDNPVTFGAIA